MGELVKDHSAMIVVSTRTPFFNVVTDTSYAIVVSTASHLAAVFMDVYFLNPWVSVSSFALAGLVTFVKFKPWFDWWFTFHRIKQNDRGEYELSIYHDWLDAEDDPIYLEKGYFDEKFSATWWVRFYGYLTGVKMVKMHGRTNKDEVVTTDWIFVSFAEKLRSVKNSAPKVAPDHGSLSEAADVIRQLAGHGLAKKRDIEKASSRVLERV